jgi:hypothetical protein
MAVGDEADARGRIHEALGFLHAVAADEALAFKSAEFLREVARHLRADIHNAGLAGT